MDLAFSNGHQCLYVLDSPLPPPPFLPFLAMDRVIRTEAAAKEKDKKIEIIGREALAQDD